MDDESYFTLAHTSINGNDQLYTSNVNVTPANVKYQPIEKVQKKTARLDSFSENGITEPYFVPSGLAVNQKIYLNECIKKRLLPFINLSLVSRFILSAFYYPIDGALRDVFGGKVI